MCSSLVVIRGNIMTTGKWREKGEANRVVLFKKTKKSKGNDNRCVQRRLLYNNLPCAVHVLCAENLCHVQPKC